MPNEHPRFDPSVSHFQPNGMDLTRYAPPTPPTPTTGSYRRGLSETEQFVIDSNIKHTSEIARIKYAIQKSHAEIERTKEVVQRDLQILQAQLEQVREEKQVGALAHQLAVVKRGPTLLELEIAPPEVMLKHFDKEVVAQVYVEQAEIQEATAKKLREDAEELLGGGKEPKMNEVKLLEQTKSVGTSTEAPLIVNGSNVPLVASMPKTQETSTGGDNVVSPGASPQSWQPLVVRQMPPPPPLTIPSTNKITFTWEFLTKELGGFKWSPGFYFTPTDPKVVSKAYWLLEREWEPFLPSTPGQHGAKLTPFFNETFSEPGQAPEEENYMNVPVFVMEEGEEGYTYYGQYSQSRYSDKLEYDRVMETVPEKIRRSWADSLASPERPVWVTKALMEHFWPRPGYLGPIPTDETIATPVTAATADSKTSTATLEKRVVRSLAAYAEELKEWEKDAKLKVSVLSAQNILEAFEKPDADAEPGMRLWWEYLQCVGYEQGFYNYLVQAQAIEQGQRRMREEAAVRVGEQAKASVAAAAAAKNAVKQAANGKEGEEKVGNGKVVTAMNGVDTAFAPAPKQSTPIKPPTSTSTPKPQTAIKTTEKPTPKPQEAKPKPQANGLQNGDLAAAKSFQESAPKARGRTSGNGGQYVLPHLRAK